MNNKINPSIIDVIEFQHNFFKWADPGLFLFIFVLLSLNFNNTN